MKTTNNTTVKINKSMVMKAAWEAIRSHKVSTFSEALRKAWQAYKIKAQMLVGVAKFTYRKINGEIRQAVGTLTGNLFHYESKGSSRSTHARTICYWDLEKKAFRSFNIETLI